MKNHALDEPVAYRRALVVINTIAEDPGEFQQNKWFNSYESGEPE